MFKIYEESETPNEKACVRYIMSRKRQMRRRVVDVMRNRTGIAKLEGVL